MQSIKKLSVILTSSLMLASGYAFATDNAFTPAPRCQLVEIENPLAQPITIMGESGASLTVAPGATKNLTVKDWQMLCESKTYINKTGSNKVGTCDIYWNDTEGGEHLTLAKYYINYSTGECTIEHQRLYKTAKKRPIAKPI